MVSTLEETEAVMFCVSCDSLEADYVLDDFYIRCPRTNVDLCVPRMYEDLSN